MLQRIRIVHFQSLKAVNIELGKLTVIVGPSSSGKTALVRALKAVTTNGLTTSQISHGAKSVGVELELADGTVTARRAGSSVSYSLSRPGQDPETYTKLSGAVPEAVEGLLGVGGRGLAPGLCVAAQFDRPYLLDETGGKIAQVLGELTNVSVIFNAAREANRRKLATNQNVKLRETDLAGLYRQAAGYKDLTERIKACTEAEEWAQKAYDLEIKRDRLEYLLNNAEVSQAALDSIPEAQQVPDYGPIELAHSRLARFKELIRLITLNKQLVTTKSLEEETALAEAAELDKLWHAKLHEAGICPTCGQSTESLSGAVVS